MKDKKTTLIIHPCQDKEGMERYLEKMAAKGWMLEKMENIFWHFKKCEPKKVKFSVVYVPKASELEGEPTEEQRSFQEFCEYAGWEIINGTGKIQVFCTEKEDVVPIDTDPELELEAIHKVGRVTRLSMFLVLFIDSILQLSLASSDILFNGTKFFAENVNIISFVGWIAVLVLAIWELGNYYMWYFKAKKQLEVVGDFAYPKKVINHGYIAVVIMLVQIGIEMFKLAVNITMGIIGLVAVAYTLFIIKFILEYQSYMKNKKMKPKKIKRNMVIAMILINLILVVVVGVPTFYCMDSIRAVKQPVFKHNHDGWKERFYDDDLPLTVQDLFGQDEEEYSYEIEESNESILLGYLEAIQHSCIKSETDYSIDYSVARVKAPFLYEFCKKEYLKADEDFDEEVVYYEKIDAVPWKAKEAYCYSWHGDKMPQYVLCYDNVIVEVNLAGVPELTQEQMAIVAEKLGGIK